MGGPVRQVEDSGRRIEVKAGDSGRLLVANN